MKRATKQKLNDTISFTIGFMAFIVMGCEVEDLAYWYVPFIGATVLFLTMFINRKVGKLIEQD